MGLGDRKKIYLIIFLGLIFTVVFIRFNKGLYLISEEDFLNIEELMITKTTFGTEGNSPDVKLEKCCVGSSSKEFEEIQLLLKNIMCKRAIKSNVNDDFETIYRIYLNQDVMKIYDNRWVVFRDRCYIVTDHNFDNVLNELSYLFI